MNYEHLNYEQLVIETLEKHKTGELTDREAHESIVSLCQAIRDIGQSAGAAGAAGAFEAKAEIDRLETTIDRLTLLIDALKRCTAPIGAERKGDR